MEASETFYKDIISQKGRAKDNKVAFKSKRTPANKKLRWTDPW
jgi:hypothetical protein